MKKLIIYGTGDIARIAHYYFTHDSNYEIAAFTIDSDHFKEKIYLGLPVVLFSDVEKKYPPSDYEIFIAISYTGLNSIRAEKYKEAKKKGYSLPSYISSKATVFDNVTIGDNCFILEDNTIQPFVKIGNNITLWSGNHIGHDAVIEDHCFISSHVVVSGFVHINQSCFLGVNATLRDNITIAPKTIIGAGAVIMEDTVEEGVYVPPRAIKLDKKSSDIRL